MRISSEIWFGSHLSRSREPSYNGTILLAVILRALYQLHHRALDKNASLNGTVYGMQTIWALVIWGNEGTWTCYCLLWYFYGIFSEVEVEIRCEKLHRQEVTFQLAAQSDLAHSPVDPGTAPSLNETILLAVILPALYQLYHYTSCEISQHLERWDTEWAI